jgi:Tfp pilus assembly protein PilX
MKKMTKIKNTGEKKTGFTLFVALIVSSMLLAVGFSLSNIILKQLIFSNSGRESQLAFYAADSGAECALYWDRKDMLGYTTYQGSFATSSATADTLDLLCGMGMENNTAPTTAKVGSLEKYGDNTSATTTFYVDYRDPNNEANHQACAKVTVSKWIDQSTGVDVERTTIDSRGYNTQFEGKAGFLDVPGIGGKCKIDNARVVERAVRLDY